MSRTERLHSLDAVRAFALLLGIVFHGGFSFIPGLFPGVWATVDSRPSAALSTVLFTAHIFRMSLFFFMAGLFARLMFHRNGAAGFWLDRARRIAAPMVVGWVVLYPALSAVWGWGIARMFGGHVPANPARLPPAVPGAFPMTHLWFLYYLLLLYVLIVGLRSVVTTLDREGRIARAADGVLGGLVHSGAAAPVLGLPLCVALYLQPAWLIWFGIPTPDQSLIPALTPLVAFGTAFTVGWLVQRRMELLQAWARLWPLHLAAALATTVACIRIAGPSPKFVPAAHDRLTFTYCLCYCIALWCWTFAITGIAVRYLSKESKARRYLADSSYWLYLAHLPVVVFLQVLVSPLQLPWSIKLALVLGPSLALLLLSYHLFVRFTWIGEVLNGRRYRRIGSADRAAPAGPPVPINSAITIASTVPGNPVVSANPGAAATARAMAMVDGTSTTSATSQDQTSAHAGSDLAPLAQLQGVHKRYGGITALAGVDLEVRPGQLLALLGPNGAGKSTAISLWLGLLEPDGGTVRLMEGSPLAVQSRREVGVMMQDVALEPTLRVRELIEIAAGYYPNAMTVQQALEFTGTTRLADRSYGKLSGGQKRQAQFAMAICGRPRLLFLDEPTVGLDVQARELMWTAIRRLVVEGCAIVLTTHYLEEAEALADRVVVLGNGRIIASGTVDEVRSRVAHTRVSCASELTPDAVRAWPNVLEASRNTRRLQITTADAEDTVRRLLATDPALRHLEVRQAGLSEAFTEITKEAA